MMANESTKEEEEQTREERKSDSQCPHMHFRWSHMVFLESFTCCMLLLVSLHCTHQDIWVLSHSSTVQHSTAQHSTVYFSPRYNSATVNYSVTN
jgi:hypothetical protein